jgi:pSer/pThr/pTyr-binding forkhead associated (FHA) protein
MRIVNEKESDLALVSDSGVAPGTVYPINDCRLIIGRRMDAQIPVDDTKASRDHAVLDRRNGHCILADLGSTNGTYVNGRKITEATRIKVGDHIRFGNSAFKVDLFSNVHSRPASTPWNDETRVDIELDMISPPLTHIIDEAVLEGSLETLSEHKELIRQARADIRKKRWIFAAVCAGLIISAILWF